MVFTQRLKEQIAAQSDIAKLQYLLDYGLNAMLNDPELTHEGVNADFTLTDKLEFETIITNRISELQAV